MTVDFRDRWLSMCEFIQVNRGHRAIEGNADYIWSIPTEDMTFQIHKGVLSVEMLAMFQKEIIFRKKHPELYSRVTRRLQGIMSYDYNANEEYVEAFALDSKSIKNFKRGNIQVSGADYELAQRGIVNTVIKTLFGARPLGISFPDITRDVHGKVARHTTQIGVVPTEISGPRFVLNLRVPPPPTDLTGILLLYVMLFHSVYTLSLSYSLSSYFSFTTYALSLSYNHIPLTLFYYLIPLSLYTTAQSFDDPRYDEYAEKWQFLHVSVKGVFDYRLRLPRGLQHQKIPEIQIEIPAFEQKKSTVETTVIAGQVRSIYEQVNMDDIDVSEVDNEKQKEEMRKMRKAQLKKMKQKNNVDVEVKTISANSVSGAELAEREMAHKQEVAASKIQAIIRKHQMRKKAVSDGVFDCLFVLMFCVCCMF